jgi:hypothetical protein
LEDGVSFIVASVNGESAKVEVFDKYKGLPPKEVVRRLLRQANHMDLITLCDLDGHYWRQLRFRLYDTEDIIRWRAIEAVGKLMAYWHPKNSERVIEYVRNLFWSLNDESGGIGWSAPQTIAEILINLPELINPYGSMMIHSSLEEPPLVKSGLWGIGRLGRMVHEAVEFFARDILAVFDSEDPETLALAARAVGEAGLGAAIPYLEKLTDRPEMVRVYVDGRFTERRLGEWVREALDRLKQTPEEESKEKPLS